VCYDEVEKTTVVTVVVAAVAVDWGEFELEDSMRANDGGAARQASACAILFTCGGAGS